MESGVHQRIAYSVSEVGDLTGLGKTKLYQMLSDGELGSRKIGRRRVIPASEVERVFGAIPADLT